MSGTGGRSTEPGFALISALTAAMPALTKVLALELAPVRVNLIAAGFVDTPLSATLLGDDLDSAVSSSARRCRSDASSARPTSRRWRSTSWRTRRSPARPTTSTAANSSFRAEPVAPRGPAMRSDIAPGGTFPDYELPDHTGTRAPVSELQGADPMILTLRAVTTARRSTSNTSSSRRSSRRSRWPTRRS